MISVVSTYFAVLLAFQPIEEIHNCNNPNLIGIAPNYVCDWEKDDFIVLKNGNKILRPVRKADNVFKSYYREKYWNKIKGEN
tara:strand:+ start:4507 stop:4752 length:246 start_codon:yes stop_codon:yes gene_type:complete